jgi:hypothetical protein
MGGGTPRAISAIVPSGITPGPLGIAETKPTAAAPATIAACASQGEAMQQTLTRGVPFNGVTLGEADLRTVALGETR